MFVSFEFSETDPHARGTYHFKKIMNTATSTTLHILSDLATPHNNSLVNALRNSEKFRVFTWYAFRHHKDLPWKEGLGGELDNYYFDQWKIRIKLFFTLIFNRKDPLLLIGYANIMNLFFLLWCTVTRRRFMMWSDHPQEKYGLSKLIRSIIYKFVKKSDPLFVVGNLTRDWFIQKGFSPEKVFNLPIFIDIPDDRELLSISKDKIRKKYNVPPDFIFAVGASRLTHAKGYDILIHAVTLLDKKILNKIRILLVGNGPEKETLLAQINKAGLQNSILLEEWLSPEDYKEVVGSADIFLHPARFDAFGGGTLFAMAYGIPVIGSEGAGTVIERINHGQNGLRYPAEEYRDLANHITDLCIHPDERNKMGLAARETAKQWAPKHGAEIVIEHILKGKCSL